ncbi:hypothetical protein JZ751_020087 [Albula glossodonta]|uniref:Uncharacterized protein n=1 Tax=Albula glossodonta TaxID=121402 RepID=A0A8T2NLH3_9TELE|nr:hypothetical protein JZ751_020087 [Albula glossodonta]
MGTLRAFQAVSLLRAFGHIFFLLIVILELILELLTRPLDWSLLFPIHLSPVLLRHRDSSPCPSRRESSIGQRDFPTLHAIPLQLLLLCTLEKPVA